MGSGQETVSGLGVGRAGIWERDLKGGDGREIWGWLGGRDLGEGEGGGGA